MKSETRLARALGLLALVPALGLPLSNPDLFWHLSAARRMRETGVIPAADWLSSTRAGAPWTDFEWACQWLFGALHRAGGAGALWAFKAAMMAFSAWLVWKALELYEAEEPARWAALALWSAASLTRSDIRPELFSLAGFGLVFLALERRRLGRPVPGAAWLVLLFALWGNLHPGFLYGLALIACYAAADRSLLPALAAAALGSALQLRGAAGFAVIWTHWRDAANISTRIVEWRAPRLDDPWHWPFWLALAAAFGGALALVRRRRPVPLGPLAAVLFFGVSASRHSRMTAYFVACGVPLAAAFLSGAGLAARPRARAALLALAAAFSLRLGAGYGLGREAFNDHFVPRRAAEFLALHGPSLPRRALYNPWGWGGYLGWRLYPGWLVFQDGRYLFHDLLVETGDALASAPDWRAFLDRRGLDVVLLENLPLRLFGRPYYALYMPREVWALVYWDEKALIFVRRSAVPAPWLREHEYAVPLSAADDARHAAELASLPLPPL